MLSVTIKSIMLSVVMLSISNKPFMLNVIRLSVIMLNIVATKLGYKFNKIYSGDQCHKPFTSVIYN